jgi:hypothetical protein
MFSASEEEEISVCDNGSVGIGMSGPWGIGLVADDRLGYGMSLWGGGGLFYPAILHIQK